eukprot:1131598-Pelagomonas_calceolata.AAC.1
MECITLLEHSANGCNETPDTLETVGTLTDLAYTWLLNGPRTPPFSPPYLLSGTHVAFIACAILCAQTQLSWSAVCPCLLAPLKVPACMSCTGAAAPAWLILGYQPGS